MELIQIIPSILIFIGGLIMILAVKSTSAILKVVEEKYKRNWRMLYYMMILFCFGYIVCIGVLLMGKEEYVPYLAGIVFLGGAFFVYIVVKTGYYVICDLISEKKVVDVANAELVKSENLMKEMNSSLEKKNKELQEFNYITSHDLQEPLRTISSFIEILEEEYKGRFDEMADQYFAFITEAVDRMRSLIKVLLDYARIGQESEFVSIDLRKLIEDCIDDLHGAVKDADAKILIVGDMPTLEGPMVELKQLFQNLISNALKFRKEGVKPVVKIYSSFNDGNYQFSVEDNGIGIEKKFQQKIFAIFQRLHAKHEYEGTGIGLAHCRKIVELFKGKIWVNSEAGNGATFHFTIPQNQE